MTFDEYRRALDAIDAAAELATLSREFGGTSLAERQGRATQHAAMRNAVERTYYYPSEAPEHAEYVAQALELADRLGIEHEPSPRVDLGLYVGSEVAR